ncbi:hypothetical protein AYI68_g666 [Smittium mucronatum]|uniref:Uncharacterized protein n=1 Tax=Smittium mucronatum TaxID=133383 RepID=A0A1R0H7G1_9FUNG|nr:hypothetical protein AYI68_g666 [Smittium mucronatum]
MCVPRYKKYLDSQSPRFADNSKGFIQDHNTYIVNGSSMGAEIRSFLESSLDVSNSEAVDKLEFIEKKTKKEFFEISPLCQQASSFHSKIIGDEVKPSISVVKNQYNSNNISVENSFGNPNLYKPDSISISLDSAKFYKPKEASNYFNSLVEDKINKNSNDTTSKKSQNGFRESEKLKGYSNERQKKDCMNNGRYNDIKSDTFGESDYRKDYDESSKGRQRSDKRYISDHLRDPERRSSDSKYPREHGRDSMSYSERDSKKDRRNSSSRDNRDSRKRDKEVKSYEDLGSRNHSRDSKGHVNKDLKKHGFSEKHKRSKDSPSKKPPFDDKKSEEKKYTEKNNIKKSDFCILEKNKNKEELILSGKNRSENMFFRRSPKKMTIDGKIGISNDIKDSTQFDSKRINSNDNFNLNKNSTNSSKRGFTLTSDQEDSYYDLLKSPFEQIDREEKELEERRKKRMAIKNKYLSEASSSNKQFITEESDIQRKEAASDKLPPRHVPDTLSRPNNAELTKKYSESEFVLDLFDENSNDFSNHAQTLKSTKAEHTSELKVDQELNGNWDDDEGYYRILLGEFCRWGN